MQYTVKRGDTLSDIADKLTGSAANFAAIAAANQIADPNKIYVGQQLVIPDELMRLQVVGGESQPSPSSSSSSTASPMSFQSSDVYSGTPPAGAATGAPAAVDSVLGIPTRTLLWVGVGIIAAVVVFNMLGAKK